MHILIKYFVVATVLVSVCRSADPPNWLGTFAVDKSCNQDECCCLDEQATITNKNATHLLISANVNGAPCREQLNGSTTVEVDLPIPADKGGFQITTLFLGTNNRFTLNSDSQYIANVNLQQPRCSGSGQRVSSNWLGTFDLDDSCNQEECCCLAEQVTITKLSDSQLLVSANVAGAPCKAQLNGSTSVEVPLPIPQDKHGFQITTILFSRSKGRFTLSYDSQSIANVNLDSPRCSGMARRSESKPSIASTASTAPITSNTPLASTTATGPTASTTSTGPTASTKSTASIRSNSILFLLFSIITARLSGIICA